MRYVLGIKIIFIFGERCVIDDIFFISIILSYHTTLMKIEIEMSFIFLMTGTNSKHFQFSYKKISSISNKNRPEIICVIYY